MIVTLQALACRKADPSAGSIRAMVAKKKATRENMAILAQVDIVKACKT